MRKNYKRIFCMFLTIVIFSATIVCHTYAENIITVLPTDNQNTIQSKINSASPGDVVKFEGGTYYLRSTLTLKSGITIRGSDTTPTVWKSDPNWLNQAHIFTVINTLGFELSDVTIENIKTENIRFEIHGTMRNNNFTTSNITLRNIEFRDGKPYDQNSGINTHYIKILAASNVFVTNCKFLRSSDCAGKGIQVYKCNNVKIDYCNFGDNGIPGDFSEAHFKTAININNEYNTPNENYSTNTKIYSNLILRNTNMSDNSDNSDHGIYALGFDGLNIAYNNISGWAPTSTGGAIKIRNGKNAVIYNNSMSRSGILCYVYANNPVKFLKNIYIFYNTIELPEHTANMYHGIGYDREDDPNLPLSMECEEAIKVSYNTLYNGRIDFDDGQLNVNRFNNNINSTFPSIDTSSGGVYNNEIHNGSMSLKSGIANSNNTFYND